MDDRPRTLGRPLDLAAAEQRARQVAALADPFRLRIISVIADAREGAVTFAEAADLLEVALEPLAEAVEALMAAGLLSYGEHGLQLTADAWVRFGRLVARAPDDHPLLLNGPLTPIPVPDTTDRIARDLAYRFSTVFSPETVHRYVVDSYALLADRAKITTYLPSLTARFASDRLSALATAQGIVLRGTPELLFVCVQNAGRSQMASAIVRHLAGERVHVRTAGSSPAAIVHPQVVRVLDEIGVPIAAEFPKPLTDEVVQAADYVVTMGCGDACPVYPGRRYMDWALEDPARLPLSGVRRVRDQIFARVETLLGEMDLRPA